MSYYYGDMTGQSGDAVSPSPYANTPYGGAESGTPLPGSSPNTMSIPSLTSSSAPSGPVGGTGGPSLGFGGTPASGYTAPSSDPLSALFGGGGSGGALSSILPMLMSAFGSSMGIPGLGALTTAAGDIGQFGTNALSGLFGLNQTGTGSTIGNDVGMFTGGLPGILAGLIANWVGGGLGREVKPEGAVSALNARGGISELLGQFIQNQGINKGFDLSEPNGRGFNPLAYGDILQALSGTQLPGLTNNGELPLGNVPGAQKPVTLYGFEPLAALQKLLPNGADLTQQQLGQIAPQLSALANRSGPGHFDKILQMANALGMKLKNAETY